MNFLTIEEEWKHYRDIAIPANAPDVVVGAIRNAFYFGAGTIFEELAPIIMRNRADSLADINAEIIKDFTAEFTEFGLSKALETMPVVGGTH